MAELSTSDGKQIVIDYIVNNPLLSYKQVGEAVGLSTSYVSLLANRAKLPRRKTGRKISKVKLVTDASN